LFELVDRPRLWILVTWPGLAPGEGDAVAKPIEHEIEVLVELIDKEEFRTIYGLADDGTPTGAGWDGFDACKRLMSNWRKVTEKGAPVPFTEARLEMLCRVPGFTSGFANAYSLAVNGQTLAREGNSDDLQAGGQADGLAGETSAAESRKANSNGTVGASA